jgi:hypothetical protein
MRNPLSLDPRLIECILSGKPIVGEPTGNGTGVVEPVVRPAAGIPCWACDEERKRGLFLDEHVHKCWLKEVA